MEHLRMHTPDMVEENVKRIGELFPNVVTEISEGGVQRKVVDFDALRQELSNVVVEGNQERYQFT